MNLRAIDKFHQTRPGYLVFGLVELGLSYLFANWALGSGAWWEWVIALVFLFGFLQNLVRMLGVHKK
jgi:hypothetical protein